MSGERAGIPSVGIMTEKFVSAAELMAHTLGAPDHPFVTILHPISSAGPERLATAARTAATACAELLVAGAPTAADPNRPRRT